MASQSSDTRVTVVGGMPWFERAWYMLLALIRSLGWLLIGIALMLMAISMVSDSGIRVVQRINDQGCPTGEVYLTNQASSDNWVITLWEPQDERAGGDSHLDRCR